ncbi:MAG: PorP/SprF family type IX secretion system membrane protein [Saprospiraceae bacterium]|nr:PorP/SprF family type IX secretion system membrane protein [Saprospiraceae bacterium]
MQIKSNTFILLVVGLLGYMVPKAQDIHFTMFDLSPLTLNPGLIGDFNGTFRVTGNYRIQWPTIAKYQTPSIGIDAPLLKGFRKNDWISFGIAAYQDKAGESSAFQLKKTSGWLGGSYHAVLNKKGTNVMSLGVQSGGTSKSLVGNPRFQDPSDPAFPGGSGGPNGDNKKSYSDLNVGLVYSSILNKEKTSALNMGVSMYHLTKPNWSLGSSQGGGTPGSTSSDKQDVLINAHAVLSIPRGDLLTFFPAIVLHNLAGNFELAGQLKGELLVNKEKDFAVQGGLGYRVGDAAFALFGARYKDLKVGLAYDFNISGATASTSGIGGYELGVSYIAKIYKKPVVKPVIFCPRF